MEAKPPERADERRKGRGVRVNFLKKHSVAIACAVPAAYLLYSAFRAMDGMIPGQFYDSSNPPSFGAAFAYYLAHPTA